MPDLVKKSEVKLTQGVTYAYEMPAQTGTEQVQEEKNDETDSVALEDLMAKLKGL